MTERRTLLNSKLLRDLLGQAMGNRFYGLLPLKRLSLLSEVTVSFMAPCTLIP